MSNKLPNQLPNGGIPNTLAEKAMDQLEIVCEELIDGLHIPRVVVPSK